MGRHLRIDARPTASQPQRPGQQLIVGLDVGDVGLHVFHQAVLTVRSPNAGVASPGMEALHGLEVLTVDVGFPVL